MKKAIIVFIAIIAVLSLAVAVIGFLGGKGIIRSNAVGISMKYDNASSYRPGNFETREKVAAVEIEWITGPVTVREWGGSTVRIEEKILKGTSTDALLMRTLLRDGTLFVRFMESGTVKVKGDLEKELLILLPPGTELGTIDVDSISSSVYIDMKAVGNVEVEVVNGNASVTTDALRCLSFSVVNGNLTLRSLSSPEKLEIKSVNGSANVTVPADASFTLRTSYVNGNVVSSIPLTAGEKGKYQAGKGDGDWRFETVNGKFILENI